MKEPLEQLKSHVNCYVKKWSKLCLDGLNIFETCNCNLFTHEALRSSYELVEKCPCVPDRIGIWKCWCLGRGENRSTWRETSRSKRENQQQTQPTWHRRWDLNSGHIGGRRLLSPLHHPCPPTNISSHLPVLLLMQVPRMRKLLHLPQITSI